MIATVQAAPDTPVDAAEAFNAPLFRAATERLAGSQRCVVLDLGAAQAATIACFGQFRCRLQVADLAEGLPAISAAATDAELERTLAATLPAPGAEPVDLVLCWDLWNYLSLPAIRALMNRIAAQGHRGTLVHSLIVYAARRMPARPGRFSPRAEGRLAQTVNEPELIDAPRYSPEALTETLPRYGLDRAMLLSNGMQEFLFRL